MARRHRPAIRRQTRSRRRCVHGYTIRGKSGRIKYIGITDDPDRRAAQHKRSGKRGKLRVETRRMRRTKARRWEAARLARFRALHGGRNPRYNKTSTG